MTNLDDCATELRELKAVIEEISGLDDSMWKGYSPTIARYILGLLKEDSRTLNNWAILAAVQEAVKQTVKYANIGIMERMGRAMGRPGDLEALQVLAQIDQDTISRKVLDSIQNAYAA